MPFHIERMLAYFGWEPQDACAVSHPAHLPPQTMMPTAAGTEPAHRMRGAAQLRVIAARAKSSIGVDRAVLSNHKGAHNHRSSPTPTQIAIGLRNLTRSGQGRANLMTSGELVCAAVDCPSACH